MDGEVGDFRTLNGDAVEKPNVSYFSSSTDKIFPAGSLNQAIFGPAPRAILMPRIILVPICVSAQLATVTLSNQSV